MSEPLGGLLAARPSIVAAGVEVFSGALRAQGVDVTDVDWRPPGFGDPDDLAQLALDPHRAAANRVAVERVLAAGSHLVDVRPAREVIGLQDRTLLHSGPPLTWEMASGEPAVLLLDVVLGHGADPDPAGSLVPALADAVAAEIPVVAALVGTEADPQGWSRQADALSAAGAAVFASNAAATRYALDLLGAAR